jgi:hypothetical protein
MISKTGLDSVTVTVTVAQGLSGYLGLNELSQFSEVRPRQNLPSGPQHPVAKSSVFPFFSGCFIVLKAAANACPGDEFTIIDE